MNILIIGSGAREHAFCWKLVQSKKTEKVYVVPGNAGTSELATNLDFEASKFKDLKQNILKHCKKHLKYPKRLRKLERDLLFVIFQSQTKHHQEV